MADRKTPHIKAIIIRTRFWIVAALAALLTAGFISLGMWQVHRLYWKLDLIQNVDARVAAPAVPAPGEADWGSITQSNDEYRHVTLTGIFLNEDEVQIYTPTVLGPGYWILTPLKRDDGTVVMINRGFVPEDLKDPAKRTQPEGLVTVDGLLRISEDRGWLFSRPNDTEGRKWFRRDIGSITETLGLSPAAPYFVDQEAGSDPKAWPRGGMTVLNFRNSHLSYAITWFAMAAMTLFMYGIFLRFEGFFGKSRARTTEEEADDEWE